MGRTKPTLDVDLQSRFTLTEPQATAVVALSEGATVTDAARQAGVTRQTVSEWKNRNPAFIAAYNGLVRNHVTQVHGQLVKLAPRAVEVLGQDLNGGGDAAARAARDILQWMHKLGPEVIGSADPLVIESELADAADHALMRALARLMDDGEDNV